MNNNSAIKKDDVLRLKIIILLINVLLVIVIFLFLGDSGIPLVSQLLLQAGALLEMTPSQVSP